MKYLRKKFDSQNVVITYGPPSSRATSRLVRPSLQLLRANAEASFGDHRSAVNSKDEANISRAAEIYRIDMERNQRARY